MIIVRRDIWRFWYVLQKTDFREHDVNIIFAGEAAADAGDLHYAFLTLHM